MLVLGLVIVVAITLIAIGMATSNTHEVTTKFWGLKISNLSIGELFLIAMVAALVGIIGLLLLLKGIKRAQRRRQKRRELERENQRLAQQRPYPPPGHYGQPPSQGKPDRGTNPPPDSPPSNGPNR